MKIVHVNAIYASKSTGTIVKEIHDRCLSVGMDSYVAFPKGLGPTDSRTYEMGSWIDHKFHALMTRVAGKQAYGSKRATEKFLHFLDEVKPDIVHLHNLHSNYIHLNMLLNYVAIHDIRTVVTMHDCWYFTGGCFHYASAHCDRWMEQCGNCPKSCFRNLIGQDTTTSVLLDKKRYLRAIPRLTIIGCSQWVAHECRCSVLGDRDIRYIPNGFDLDTFRPRISEIKKKLGIESKRVILGPAAKWNLKINGETYRYFVEHLPKDTILLLFGARDTTAQTPENVLLYGYLHSPVELAELYSMADLMVNCSREDTLSSLNLECQACGIPVVTYEATGSMETVDGQCGFAVETGNYKMLFDTSMKVLNRGKQTYSLDCRTWIADHFEKNANYQKYIELYNEEA